MAFIHKSKEVAKSERSLKKIYKRLYSKENFIFKKSSVDDGKPFTDETLGTNNAPLMIISSFRIPPPKIKPLTFFYEILYKITRLKTVYNIISIIYFC
jgi:DNA-directed RNA polymerase beta' subunit